MNLVGRLNDPRIAQSFVDYMALKNVQCHIATQDQYFVIGVENNSDLDAARAEFEMFAENPSHARYRSASWERTDSSRVQFNYGSSGTPLLHQLWVQAGPVTLVILAVTLIIGLLSQIGLAQDLFSMLHFPAPFDQQVSQIWRLFTPAIMHFALAHLLFNLVWWWYLGGRIEREVGAGKLITLFLAGALLSNGLQGVVVGPNFLGLSGVVYALLGYVAVAHRRYPALALPPAYIGFMLVWLGLGFAGLLGSHIANFAHLGGLLVGAVQGFIDTRQKQS
ncbi:rhomboid family intramembrane serine protease GlpG [Echinimonas agarilytica]|uniref:Rhomboid family intramembrane serine protease GlpG n=1 Tax=Echinimonas agarilytica TaxID=1215918 RepID=A0AA41W838_9GAMM|nr:rhomboid family intramembrane serine protease GlpG [Echinimonas agarilytica]MCM2680925.1 rhomboid family intramembrane serine protease GlpG [Echinimonas agarilytica]